MQLAAHRLSEIAAAVAGGLDWCTVPDAAWNAAVVALDLCVLRVTRPWIDGDAERVFVANTRLRKRATGGGLLRSLRQPRHPAVPRLPYELRWIRTEVVDHALQTRPGFRGRWLFD